MKPILHAAGGCVSLLLVMTFWTATVFSELFMDKSAVVAVKHAIAVYGVAMLVLAMALTGGTGFRMARARTGKLLARKMKRMPFIACNGFLVMIPCAVFLFQKSAAQEFDRVFYSVQAIELVVGLVQLVLLGLNFRDGLKLSGRLRSPKNSHMRGGIGP